MKYYLTIYFTYGHAVAGRSPSVSVAFENLPDVNSYIKEFQDDKTRIIQGVECIRGERLEIKTENFTETRQVVTGRTYTVA